MSNNKFKVGQVWQRKNGTLAKIEKITKESSYPICDDSHMTYTEDGRHWCTFSSDVDLVELVEDVEENNKCLRCDVGDARGLDLLCMQCLSDVVLERVANYGQRRLNSGLDDIHEMKPKFNTFNSGGQKDTAGKSRFDLIPPEIEKSLAEVYTLGAKKYDDRNWEKGIPFSICIASLRRHLNKFQLGEDINTDDGDKHHLEHVLWWAAALVTFVKRGRTDLDDRVNKC